MALYADELSIMNSKIAIGIFAILMCAAFAGVAVAGDDANAGSQVLQYTVGTTVYSETVDTDTVTLKDLEALGCTIPEGKTFPLNLDCTVE